MNRKNGIIFIVVLVIIVAIVVIFWFRGSGNASLQPAGSGAGVPSQAYSPTRAPAPANAVAPNEGSAMASAGIAVPSVQAMAAPGSSASYRSFVIKISNNTYNPNTIIVNQGDTVNLEITALDANYGFNQPDYGLSASIIKGKTQTIQFQALESGEFTFFCGSCGGPSKGPVGHLVVTAE